MTTPKKPIKTPITPRSLLMLYKVTDHKGPLPMSGLTADWKVSEEKILQIASSLDGVFVQDSLGRWCKTQKGNVAADRLDMLKVPGMWFPGPKFNNTTFGAVFAHRYLEVMRFAVPATMAEEFGISVSFCKQSLRRVVAQGDAVEVNGEFFLGGEDGAYVGLTNATLVTLDALWAADTSGTGKFKAWEIQPSCLNPRTGRLLSVKTTDRCLGMLASRLLATRVSSRTYQITTEGIRRAKVRDSNEDLGALTTENAQIYRLHPDREEMPTTVTTTTPTPPDWVDVDTGTADDAVAAVDAIAEALLQAPPREPALITPAVTEIDKVAIIDYESRIGRLIDALGKEQTAHNATRVALAHERAALATAKADLARALTELGRLHLAALTR